MKITKEQILKMDRKASRDFELENNLRASHHKVHKSKKTYTRKPKHKKNLE
jgi:hypothetical protein